MNRLLAMFAACLLAFPVHGAGNAERGKNKAAQKINNQACAECHGANGDTPKEKDQPILASQYADYIIKVDPKTLIPTYYRTPTANSGPRRGHFDDQDRLWFAENRGHRS